MVEALRHLSMVIMARPRNRRRLRDARLIIAVLCYLVGFAALLMIAGRFYLLPAAAAASHADPARRKVLAAQAMLVLAVVLVILLVSLLLTFRVSRFFRPRPPTTIKPTKYVDAWAESGRRMKVPEKEQE